MKCADVAFSVVPRIGAGDAENRNRVFDMIFCFGKHLAPYVLFSTRIYLQHIARPVESDHRINIVFVRPFFRCRAITLQPLGIDLCNFKI